MWRKSKDAPPFKESLRKVSEANLQPLQGFELNEKIAKS